MEIRQYYMGQQPQGAALTSAKLPTFTLNKALQANATTLRHAGRLSVSSAAAAITNSLPMHNPYAQVPLVSRHWASRRQIFKQAA